MVALFFTIFTILPFSSSSGVAGPSQSDSTWRADQLYIALFTLGPSWDGSKQAFEQAGFREHSANLARLRKEGRALVGARYGATGMIVFGASSLEDAQAQFANDPMITGRLFVLELEKFRPFYDGYIPK